VYPNEILITFKKLLESRWYWRAGLSVLFFIGGVHGFIISECFTQIIPVPEPEYFVKIINVSDNVNAWRKGFAADVENP
jgi:hypothetical protein